MDISYYKKYEPIFGSWHIVREIGEGNFGKVFEIERRDFGRIYKAALKIITVPKNQSELKNAMLEFDDDHQSVTDYFRGFVEEMVDEFALMSRLKGNSNIVSYEDHAVFEHDDGFGWDILIRMELLTPMLDYMHTKQFGVEKIIKLGTDMCKALEHCGKLNIIHRDIKPENIFVSEFGDFKLGDFGVARVAEETMGNMSRKGTYNYMAPEVYKGEPYGADVDTYSLGLMLFRLLNNNRAPFLPEPPAPIKMTDREAALTRRMKGEAIPAPANADKALADIILKACAYNLKDRYASPTEMRIALESLGAETTVSVHEMKNKIENISETETLREGEETDRTVSIFGASKVIEAVENKQKAEEATVIEIPAEVEPIQNVGEDGGTAVIEDNHEAEKTTLIKDDKTTLIEDNNITKEQNGVQDEVENKKTKKKTKRIAVLVSLAAVLLIAAIVLLPHRVGTRWSDSKVHLNNWRVYTMEFTKTVEDCKKIQFAYRIKSKDNDSVYGTQRVFVKRTYGAWEYAGRFTAEDSKPTVVNLYIGNKNIDGIAVVPARGYGAWSYNISLVKCFKR